MLRVTVELIPYGQEQWGRVIDVITIVNDGMGTPQVGNYTATTGDAEVKLSHYREDGALQLVAEAAYKLVGERFNQQATAAADTEDA